MRKKLLALVGLLVLVALAAMWATPRSSEATTFSPFFGPPDFYRLDPTTAGANSDVHAQYNIFAPAGNFTGLMGGAFTLGDPAVSVSDAATIPNVGAYVGQLDSTATLGLLNNGCFSPTPVTFNFVESNVVTTARPFTNGGAMTVGAGGIPAALDDAITTFTYSHTLDPLGLRAGADGTATEGTIQAGVNEIRVGTEEMLVVGVDTTANTYQAVRGWNGTPTALHNAGDAVSRVAVIYPNGPSTNLLANLGEDDGDLDNNGVAEEVLGTPGGASFNGNQVADGADAVPSFVRDSLDPNANADDGGYVQARARYAGVAFVANTLIVILQFVVMDLGALQTFPNLDWVSPTWGYANLTFLQDPVAPPSNSSINDFCNFSSQTDFFGIPHDNTCTGASPPLACTGEGGTFQLRLAVDNGCPAAVPTTPNECGNQNGGPPEVVRQTNPASPTVVRYYQYGVSQRDYDDDGHENALDTCHSVPNPSWNPRTLNNASGGDDSDGAPTVCDPTPGTAAADADGDVWENRLDNCLSVPNTFPGGTGGGGGLVANTFQYDRDVLPGVDTPDGGPASDSIGPDCDFNGAPGWSCAGCPALTPTGANGHYHAAYAAQTICIGAVATPNDCSTTLDSDGDGVVNDLDTCMGDVLVSGTFLGANPPLPYPDGPAADDPGRDSLAVQANAGTNSVTVNSAAGFVLNQPIIIGTGSTTMGTLETLKYVTGISGNTITFANVVGPPARDQRLAKTHSPTEFVAQVAFSQSMRDLTNDGVSDISDIDLASGKYGSLGGDPANDGVGDAAPPGYEGRVDLTYDSVIDIADIDALAGVFGSTCGPP